MDHLIQISADCDFIPGSSPSTGTVESENAEIKTAAPISRLKRTRKSAAAIQVESRIYPLEGNNVPHRLPSIGRQKRKKVSVVIPVLNESRRIAQVVRFALDSSMVQEVLVIDDGSIDGTPALTKAAGTRMITSTMLDKAARWKMPSLTRRWIRFLFWMQICRA